MNEFKPSMLVTDKFKIALEFTLRYEGGYSLDPDDLGGETNFGISKRAYPQLDIKALTKQAASDIYRRDFWEKCHCDIYELDLAMALFDTAVNCGPARAIEWAADCRGKVEVLLFLRMLHYAKIDAFGNNKKYISGWLDRVAALYNEGKKYAGG